MDAYEQFDKMYIDCGKAQIKYGKKCDCGGSRHVVECKIESDETGAVIKENYGWQCDGCGVYRPMGDWEN
jgi:hypothetical protein